MRVTSIDKLDEPGLRYRLHFADQEQGQVVACILAAFENSWWLFHLEEPIMGRTFTMILVNRDGEVSVPPAKWNQFTLKPAPREDYRRCRFNPEKFASQCTFCRNEQAHPEAPGA